MKHGIFPNDLLEILPATAGWRVVIFEECAEDPREIPVDIAIKEVVAWVSMKESMDDGALLVTMQPIFPQDTSLVGLNDWICSGEEGEDWQYILSPSETFTESKFEQARQNWWEARLRKRTLGKIKK